MKVKIIKANGIKEINKIFDFEFLQKYINKVTINNDFTGSSTGKYITTISDSTTTKYANLDYTTGIAFTVNTSSAKLYSQTS